MSCFNLIAAVKKSVSYLKTAYTSGAYISHLGRPRMGKCVTWYQVSLLK
jgi:hypothetical protein